MKDKRTEDLFTAEPEMPDSLSKSSIIEKIEKRNITKRL